MTSLGRLIAVVLLLLAGAVGGWLASTVLPPSPLGAALARMGLAGGEAGAPGAGGGGGRGGGGQPAPVAVAPAEEREFVTRVKAVGTAQSAEAIDVSPLSAGRLAALHVATGATVSPGDVLMELDATRQAAELAEAEARVTDARQRLDRAVRAGQAVSAAQRDQLAAEMAAAEARANVVRYELAQRRVTAPFAGVIGLVQLSVGAMVDERTVLTTLDDVARMKVRFSVPERFLGGLRPGLTAIASAAAFPGEVFLGTIAAIDTRIDTLTRSVVAEAVIDNDAGRIRPGMFLTIELELSAQRLVAVPEESLVVQGGDAFVYVLEGEAVRRVPVTIARRSRGHVAVVGEVAAGDSVVVAGQQRLRDGASVRVVADAPAPPPAGAGEG
jgi:membrane fusion protein (multidrug efflux system)